MITEGERQKIDVIRRWTKRRRSKGIEPTSDDIWQHIQLNWPSLPEEKKEIIFQNSN